MQIFIYAEEYHDGPVLPKKTNTFLRAHPEGGRVFTIDIGNDGLSIYPFIPAQMREFGKQILKTVDEAEDVSTLQIENVDLDKLNKQRLVIAKALLRVRLEDPYLTLSSAEFNALNSLVNMLDEWSDKRYFAEKDEP